MEKIYNGDLNNVYNDILNSQDPKLEYEGWKLYLKAKYNIVGMCIARW